jgi:hypothetical protein
MTPKGDWQFAQTPETGATPDPMCACGHQKSDHYIRYKCGPQEEHLECEVQEEVMQRDEQMRKKRCPCRWFRLALGQ